MTGPASRLAALGLLVLALGAVAFGLVLPLVSRHAALEAEAAMLEAQLARLSERLAGVSAPAPLVVDEPALIEAASPARASAELQERLSASVAAAGGDLRSIRAGRAIPLGAGPGAPSGAPATEAGALRLPVEVEFETTVTGMKAFLHDIEAQRPYVVVEAVEARRLTRGRDEPTEETRIFLRVEVAGFAAPPGDA
jgi:hypothetical protein